MNLKFYTSVAKVLILKVSKFYGLVPAFVEVTGEKLVGECLFALPSHLNIVKIKESLTKEFYIKVSLFLNHLII